MIGREVGHSLPRFARLSGEGASQLGVHTASALSPPLSLYLLSPSRPPSSRRLSLSLPLFLSLSKGSGAQGFGTERARLVVQVERLWCTRLRHRTCKTSGSSQIRCTRLRHRTCKTSGSSQKKGLLPMGISIFFSQKGPATYGDFDFFFSKFLRF